MNEVVIKGFFILNVIMFIGNFINIVIAFNVRNDANRRSSDVQDYCVDMINEAHWYAEQASKRK